MGLPKQPVTLTPEQIAELNRCLSKMRHDVNNYLSVLVAAVELLRIKPDAFEKWIGSISEQPTRIQDSVKNFSVAFEQTFGITRP